MIQVLYTEPSIQKGLMNINLYDAFILGLGIAMGIEVLRTTKAIILLTLMSLTGKGK